MSNILDQRGCDGVMGVMVPHSRRGVGQQILHGQDVARVQCTPPNPPRVTPPPSHPHPFFILSQPAPLQVPLCHTATLPDMWSAGLGGTVWFVYWLLAGSLESRAHPQTSDGHPHCGVPIGSEQVQA